MPSSFSIDENILSLSVPGDYFFSIITPSTILGDCSIPTDNFSIPESINVSLEYTINDPICVGSDGFFSGILDGPSGIYNIYFDENFVLETSLGINEIDFNIPFAWPTSTNANIAITDLIDLDLGDQIGVFFSSNDGLICAGNYIISQTDLDAGVFSVATWGDDPSTSSIQDGFQEGEEYIFLVKKNDGIVYDVTLSYADPGTMTATNTNDFSENGMSVITNFSVEQPFVEYFDTNLSSGTHLLQIFNSAGCLVYENENVDVGIPPNVLVDSETTNSSCFPLQNSPCSVTNTFPIDSNPHLTSISPVP